MKNNSLTKLIETLLHNYENIDKINIAGLEGNNIYDIISNTIHFDRGDLVDTLPQKSTSDPNAFWRSSVVGLVNTFNDNFKEREDSEQREAIVYEAIDTAAQLDLIQNNRRINIQDINANFTLIAKSFDYIFEELFSWRQVPSGGTSTPDNKYLIMFKAVFEELLPLWENILYLWLSFFLKEREKIEKAVIKYVYLNETDFLNFRKFDIKDSPQAITIDQVISKIEVYIDEYPNNHLCIIPIIRRDNYYSNYYSEEIYPGIFYHAPNFNNQLFKTQRSFLYYPFRNSRNTSMPAGINYFNPFTEDEFVRTSCKTDGSENNFDLSNKVYGYRIFENDLYYAAPFNLISTINEIFPKSYYTIIRGVPFGSIYASNGILFIEKFGIKYHDVIAENITGNETIVGQYSTIDNLNKGLCFVTDWSKVPEKYLIEDVIFLTSSYTNDTAAQCELTKKKNFRNSNIQFPYYSGECITAKTESRDNDYSYLIEYVPLESEPMQNSNYALITADTYNKFTGYIGSSSDPSSKYVKDNDLLEKHYDWDNERNNILEEKFVLRIGQHIIPENYDSSKKNLMPSDKEQQYTRTYFDYDNGSTEIKEKTENMDYYNNGTIEAGAYLNIPFIKNPKKRVIYYPDYLSHSFGSDFLIPLNSVSLQDSQPEYLAYNKLYRDFPIQKDSLFEIYTKRGDEDFENDDWIIKVVEVVSQFTPDENTFFNGEDLPPAEEASMEELYQYYTNVDKDKIDESILPYFSQVNPSSTSETPPDNPLLNYSSSYLKHVKKQFKPVVEYFFEENERDAAYQDIANKLLVNKTDEQIYPVHYLRTIYGRNLQGEMVNSGQTDIYKTDLRDLNVGERNTDLSSITSSSTVAINKQLVTNTRRLYNIDDDNPNSDKHIYYRLGIYGSDTAQAISAAQPTSLWPDAKYSATLIEDENLDVFSSNITISGLTCYDSVNDIWIYYKEINDNTPADYSYLIEQGASLPGEYIWHDSLHPEIPDRYIYYLASNQTNYFYSLMGKITNPSTGYYFLAEIINGELKITSIYYCNPTANTRILISNVNLNSNSPLCSKMTPYIQDINMKITSSINYKDEAFAYYFCSPNSSVSSSLRNKILDYQYLYEGFCCTHGSFAENIKTYIDFQIFGMNFPFVTMYGDTTNYALSDFYRMVSFFDYGNPSVRHEGICSYDNASAFSNFDINTSHILNGKMNLYKSGWSDGHEYFDRLNGYAKGKGVLTHCNFSTSILRPKPVDTIAYDIDVYDIRSSKKHDCSTPYVPNWDGGLYEFNPALKPFFNIFYYPITKINFVQHRQYPFIYLLSRKTKIPNNNYFRKQEGKQIRYRVRQDSGIFPNASTKDFYTYSSITANNMPFPFPNTKEKDQLTESSDSSYNNYNFTNGWANLITHYSFIQGTHLSLTDLPVGVNPRNLGGMWQTEDTIACQNDPSTRAYINLNSAANAVYYPGGNLSLSWTMSHNVKRSIDASMSNSKFYQLLPAHYYQLSQSEIDTMPNYLQQYMQTGWINPEYYGGSSSDLHAGTLVIPNISKNDFPVKFQNIHALDDDTTTEVNEIITYKNTAAINIETKLSYAQIKVVSQMNLQVIIHYFGPHGAYARKAITRQRSGSVNPYNHFILDGSKKLTYYEWNNNWQVEYFNQAQFAQFESQLQNAKLFKRSLNATYWEGNVKKVYDFETNPNTGTNDPEAPTFIN